MPWNLHPLSSDSASQSSIDIKDILIALGNKNSRILTPKANLPARFWA
jgi:hypothetical protein